MNRNLTLLLLVVFCLLQMVMFLPVLNHQAFAAEPGLGVPNIPPIGLPGTNSDTASGWLLKLVNIALAVVGILAVLYLIYGGFRYITSAGNQEAAEAGKKAIQNAIIGLIVIILSYVIVTVIVNAIGSSIQSPRV